MDDITTVAAVDFGTTRSATAVMTDGGEAVILPEFASAVARFTDDGVSRRYVGADAEALLGDQRHAGAVLRCPKNKVRDRGTSVFHFPGDEAPHHIGVVVEWVLAHAVALAEEHLHGRPRALAVTHPAAWTPETDSYNVLRGALFHLGFEPRLVSEPEAVAYHVFSAGQLDLDDGAAVAVYDMGGGTTDVAVVRRSNGRLETLTRSDHTTHGLRLIGGEVFDDLLYRYVLEELVDDPGARELLRADSNPDASAALNLDPQLAACGRALRRSVRRARETLSKRRTTSLELPAPLAEGTLSISRDDVERVINDPADPIVDLTIDLLEAGIAEAGGDVAAIVLAGGASQTPLVRRLISERQKLGGIRIVTAQPHKGAVALGAARWLWRSQTEATRRAHQNQVNGTKLVQHDDWDEVAESSQAWLRNAVLNSPCEEDIADLLVDVGLLGVTAPAIDGGTLVVTSARLLWSGVLPNGKAHHSEVRLAALKDVRPVSSATMGLIGMRVVSDKGTRTYLLSADDDDLLDWIDYVGQRLPSGAPTDSTAMVAILRRLLKADDFKSGSQSGAWLVHAVATATTPEEFHQLQVCNDKQTTLLTTSERLVWTRDGTPLVGKTARFADITKITGRSSESDGLFGFRVTVSGKDDAFKLWHAQQNIAYICARQGKTPPIWVRNVAKLRTFAGWADVHVDGRDYIEHALVHKDDVLLAFAHCRYVSEGFWGQDVLKTTALMVTSQRVVWARVGAIAGLDGHAVPVAKVTKVGPMPNGVALTIDGRNHGFVGFPSADMVRILRGLRNA